MASLKKGDLVLINDEVCTERPVGYVHHACLWGNCTIVSLITETSAGLVYKYPCYLKKISQEKVPQENYAALMSSVAECEKGGL